MDHHQATGAGPAIPAQGWKELYIFSDRYVILGQFKKRPTANNTQKARPLVLPNSYKHWAWCRQIAVMGPHCRQNITRYKTGSCI